METLFNWTWENKSWLFEGLGVTALGWLAFFFYRKNHDRSGQSQVQRGGAFSKNTQIMNQTNLDDK